MTIAIITTIMNIITTVIIVVIMTITNRCKRDQKVQIQKKRSVTYCVVVRSGINNSCFNVAVPLHSELHSFSFSKDQLKCNVSFCICKSEIFAIFSFSSARYLSSRSFKLISCRSNCA